MRWRSILCVAMVLAGLVGCDRLAPAPPAPPAKPNPFDGIYPAHRTAAAKGWWEAGHTEFKTESEERAWLVERWKSVETDAWSPIRKAEQKYLGDGKWTPARAKTFRRKLALLADPNVEKSTPLDDLNFDEDDDGL